jgi:hypothetical protein
VFLSACDKAGAAQGAHCWEGVVGVGVGRGVVKG